MRTLIILTIFMLAGCNNNPAKNAENKSTGVNERYTISKEQLKDKIKGAWAAQTIGVTFGVPAEFKYNTTMVQDNQKLHENNTLQLFNLKNDMEEQNDLSVAEPEKAMELQKMLHDWRRKVNAKMMEPNPEFVLSDTINNLK